MKIGRFTLSGVSLALLIIQLALISTIAAKYLYQRSACPRVWTRAAAVDPRLPMRGRYLSLRLTVDGCQSTLPSAKDATFPRKYDGTVKPGPYVLNPQPVDFQANLKVANNRLIAVRRKGPGRLERRSGDRRQRRRSLRPDAARLPRRLFHLRYSAKPVAAQIRPGALDRSDGTAQRPAAPHAAGPQRQRNVEAAGFEIAARGALSPDSNPGTGHQQLLKIQQ